MKFLRKYHKWAGIILAFFLLIFSVSGIILNHRELLSSMDVSRSLLPANYNYKHWNNAAVRSSEKISADSILVYGNIGIWLTDSTASAFSDFNSGFPKGIDNRKIFKVFKSSTSELLAGTQFGLYRFVSGKWNKLHLPVHESNVVDIAERMGETYIMTRSHVLKTSDLEHFQVLHLPAPDGYDNKIGLFKTFWVIHSGEIYGITGKLLVDLMGLVLTFLTITGLIIWINRKSLKLRNKERHPKKEEGHRNRKLKLSHLIFRISGKDTKHIKSQFKWNLKWHNKIGWITLVFVLLTVVTGMFLRPPFLIAINDARVAKIPHTELDTDNAWFDILRRIIYIPEKDEFIVSTYEGFYKADPDFKSIDNFNSQPPASIMGVTVLQEISPEKILVGSFEGLFVWNTETGDVWDMMKGEWWHAPEVKGPPVGDFKITGMITDLKKPVVFDYTKGSFLSFNGTEFPDMPVEISERSPISLWNVALEFHTGRIFEFMMGLMYFLIVPLVGLASILLSISGFIVWWKHHRR